MAFLESISKEDLGVFLAGQDFIGVQSMTESLQQSVQYRTAFGFAHPVIRVLTAADENQVSFSFMLLKAGVIRGLNSYKVLQQMQDFEIQTKKDVLYETYADCNWTRINIDSGMDAVTVNVDCSVPGFIP